jgi:hypothetical protein
VTRPRFEHWRFCILYDVRTNSHHFSVQNSRIFITETRCVYSEVWTDSINTILVNLTFRVSAHDPTLSFVISFQIFQRQIISNRDTQCHFCPKITSYNRSYPKFGLSFLLEFKPTSPDNWSPTFRENLVVSSSSWTFIHLKIRPLLSLQTSEANHPLIWSQISEEMKTQLHLKTCIPKICL